MARNTEPRESKRMRMAENGKRISALSGSDLKSLHKIQNKASLAWVCLHTHAVCLGMGTRYAAAIWFRMYTYLSAHGTHSSCGKMGEIYSLEYAFKREWQMIDSFWWPVRTKAQHLMYSVDPMANAARWWCGRSVARLSLTFRFRLSHGLLFSAQRQNRYNLYANGSW